MQKLTPDWGTTTTPEPSSKPVPLRPGAWWIGLAWLIAGLVFAALGTAVAVGLTAASGQVNNEYGFLYLVTAPLGWLAGWVVALLIGRRANKHRVYDGTSRTLLVSIGPLLPVLLMLVRGVLPI